MNFPPHFLVLLFKTAFHLDASTKFALLGLNLFIFLKASISSLILLDFSDFRLSNRLENPVAIYPSMTVENMAGLHVNNNWIIRDTRKHFFIKIHKFHIIQQSVNHNSEIYIWDWEAIHMCKKPNCTYEICFMNVSNFWTTCFQDYSIDSKSGFRMTLTRHSQFRAESSMRRINMKGRDGATIQTLLAIEKKVTNRKTERRTQPHFHDKSLVRQWDW